MPYLDSLITSVERLRFALRLMGRTTDSATDAKLAVTQLGEALLELPDRGAPTLLRLQANLAEVARRAWQTATAVARRGAYSAEDLPPIMRIRFASRDQRQFAVFAFPRGNIWDTTFTARLKDKLEAIDPQTAGFVISTHVHTEMIRSGFERAALLAALIAFLTVLLDFRHVGHTLLALLPLAVGVLWMHAAMAALGLEFNVANIVALPLVLGIGVDTGIHVVHRCREAWQRGESASLRELMSGTGGAVLLSTVTTIAGFACLMVADYGAMQSLGLTMVIGVNACLIASLVVLPALLLVLGRVRAD